MTIQMANINIWSYVTVKVLLAHNKYAIERRKRTLNGDFSHHNLLILAHTRICLNYFKE